MHAPLSVSHRRWVLMHACMDSAFPLPDLCLPTVQVWTYGGRVAFVLSVTAKGQPIHEDIRLQRLQQLLLLRMSPDGAATVNTHKVVCCCMSCAMLLYASSWEQN